MCIVTGCVVSGTFGTVVVLRMIPAMALVSACSQPPAEAPKPAAPAPAAAPAPSPAERGKYLVTVGGCDDCHTPKTFGPNGPELDMSRRLSGHPAADKLLLVSTFTVLTLPNIGLVNRLPLWLTVLVISRDVGIVLTVAIVNLAVGPRTFKPSPLGKTATAIFIVACVVVMLFNYLGYHSRWVDAAIYLTLMITVASGVDYVWRIARIINK